MMHANEDWQTMQVLYHMYEEAELKPLLDNANKEVAKEKEEES